MCPRGPTMTMSSIWRPTGPPRPEHRHPVAEDVEVRSVRTSTNSTYFVSPGVPGFILFVQRQEYSIRILLARLVCQNAVLS